jgi:hypothetical protein
MRTDIELGSRQIEQLVETALGTLLQQEIEVNEVARLLRRDPLTSDGGDGSLPAQLRRRT